MAIASLLAALPIAYGLTAALSALLRVEHDARLRRSARRERAGARDVLRRMWLFSECSEPELDLIASSAGEVAVPAGEALIREGELRREVFAVIDGAVEVRQKGRALPTKGGTELFGEIAAVSARPRTASVTAVSPVRALVVSEPSFSNLLRRAPHLQLKVLRTLAERGVPVWGAAFAR
jgi:signal-transduction protein with cAMP-binding, CBS, and nucleotidyltransferase domain